MRDYSTQNSRQVSPVVDNRHLSPHVIADIPPQMGKNLGNWNPANNWKYLVAMGLLGGGYGAYRAMSGRKSQNAVLVPLAQAPKEIYGPDRTFHEPGNHSNLARYFTPTPTPSEVTGTNPMNNTNMTQP